MMKNSYFMRIFYWDEDEEAEAPVFIKIPMVFLAPSPNMLRLLVAIEKFYGVECYLTIPDIQELSSDKIGIIPSGVATSETMLVTTCYDDAQFLCSITSASGEYELLALGRDGDFQALVADQRLANYLGLEYIEEVTDLHHKYLEDLGCGDSLEYVYFPSALY